MSKKVLQITRCSDPLRGYSHLVGEQVDFLGDEGDHYEYRSRDTGGYINFVLKKDAQIIEVTNDR